MGNTHGKYLYAGTRLILTALAISTFASMWISNIAAPVLTFTVIQPILDSLPRGVPLSNALILGVALAANIGGMGTPGWAHRFTTEWVLCVMASDVAADDVNANIEN